jgi:hypothetical protein
MTNMKTLIFTQDGSEGLRGLIAGFSCADESDEETQLLKTASEGSFAAAFMRRDYTEKATTVLSALSYILTPSKSRERVASVSIPFYAGSLPVHVQY